MPDTDETREYFDRRADELAPDKLVDKWPAIEPMFRDLPSGARVLECGAGTGLYTVPMLEAGYRVCSVDLSQRGLDLLTDKCRQTELADNLETCCGEFNAVAASAGGDFDVVTFIKVLHHFADAQSIREAIRVAWSSLKPGGRIVGFEPNGSCPFWYLYLRWLRGGAIWEAERNYLLVRRRLFESVFRTLPEATWSFDYRFFVPAIFIKRAPALDAVDRFACRVPALNRIAGNIRFVVTKEA